VSETLLFERVRPPLNVCVMVHVSALCRRTDATRAVQLYISYTNNTNNTNQMVTDAEAQNHKQDRGLDEGTPSYDGDVRLPYLSIDVYPCWLVRWLTGV